MSETALHLIRAWGELGPPGLLLLAAIFIVGAMAFLPGPALCLIGGLVFGVSAVPVALLASTAGAVLAFLLSRYLLQSPARRLVDRSPRVRPVVDAIDAEGWRVVALLRLSPLPGTGLSYVLGVTGVTLRDFAAGTLLGRMPAITVFVTLGAMAGAILEATSVKHAHLAFLATGVVALALAAGLIARKARAILAQRPQRRRPA
jgi:uncharacterized membrane protein YdjX (TVP38/TMEM64 family)